MNRISMSASIPGAGKTATALLLECHFRGQSMRAEEGRFEAMRCLRG